MYGLPSRFAWYINGLPSAQVQRLGTSGGSSATAGLVVDSRTDNRGSKRNTCTNNTHRLTRPTSEGRGRAGTSSNRL